MEGGHQNRPRNLQGARPRLTAVFSLSTTRPLSSFVFVTSAFLSLRAHSPCFAFVSSGPALIASILPIRMIARLRVTLPMVATYSPRGPIVGRTPTSPRPSAIARLNRGISAVPAGAAAVDADVGEPSDKQSSGRSRQFRQRKLSKDYIPDDSDGASARDAMLRGSPLSSHASSSPYSRLTSQG